MVPVDNVLRRYITRERISASELSRRIGVNRSTVSMWLRGLKSPSLRCWLKIQKVCKEGAKS